MARSALELSPQQREIARLVQHAAAAGTPDVFVGKRSWSRYELGERLEVTTDPADPTRVRPANMHNISGGGIGLWSHDEYPRGQQLWVRAWPPEPGTLWIPGCVTHAGVGLGGYLIGLAFDAPLPPQDGAQAVPQQAGADTPKQARTPTATDNPRRPLRAAPPEPRPPRQAEPAATARGRVRPGAAVLRPASFRNNVSLLSGVAATAGVLGIQIVAHFYVVGLPWWLLTTLLAVSAGACAALCAWCALGYTTRYLRTLTRQVQDATSAASSGTAALDAAELLELQAALQKQQVQSRVSGDLERAKREQLEELNTVRSNILNSVSHDLRTPLTSIRLYSEMLSQELTSLAKTEQKQFLDIISEECKRLDRVVEDLLEAQRVTTGALPMQLRKQDVAGLIRGCALVFEPMAASKSLTLRIECPDTLPEVTLDPDRISQVLSNLVSNAIKYTPSGGAVQISARASQQELLLCVADNGPGIPREKWDQIFERFAQVSVSFVREIGGVGLGLYIVRQIVAAHGGRVWLDSEVGKGSSFYIALPLRSATAAQPAQRSHKGRVLVCDADPELSSRIAHLIERADFETRVVHSGCRMLAALAEFAPSVVVTDVLLPDMNAADLLAALAKQRETCAFRLVTHTPVGDVDQLRRFGADIVLVRPARPEELLQAVQVAARGGAGGGLTLLLLAEDGDMRKRLSGMLLDAGNAALLADDVPEARRYAREYKPDAVLVWDWPEAAIEALRQSLEVEVPIIILSRRNTRRARAVAGKVNATLIHCPPGHESHIPALVSQALRPLTPSGH